MNVRRWRFMAQVHVELAVEVIERGYHVPAQPHCPAETAKEREIESIRIEGAGRLPSKLVKLLAPHLEQIVEDADLEEGGRQ